MEELTRKRILELYGPQLEQFDIERDLKDKCLASLDGILTLGGLPKGVSWDDPINYEAMVTNSDGRDITMVKNAFHYGGISTHRDLALSYRESGRGDFETFLLGIWRIGPKSYSPLKSYLESTGLDYVNGPQE